jgi:endonuclease G
MKYPKWLEKEQRKLAEERRHEREQAIRLILEGEVLKVEPDRERLARVIADRVKVDTATAALIAEGVPLETLGLTPKQVDAARDISEVDNSVSMKFADLARSISKAVGRVTTVDGTARGSCFMISPRLLATAGHVLRDSKTVARRRVEFNFEQRGSLLKTRARFTLDPNAFFFPRDEMGFDCAIVALGGNVDPTPFAPGHCPLSERGDKHALGFFANLIHHPGSKAKHFVLRENRLIDRPDESRPNGGAGVGRPELLAYRGQTDPGSSGAPVFNDVWEVVALHFWGATLQPLNLGGIIVRDNVNHGVRASAIVAKLQELRPRLTAERQALLDAAISVGNEGPAVP